MGYIGNEAQTAFTSFDKQTITGDGGTTYTLTHSVANEREIEVFVNNVRQEPSVAYNVSGNTLTMTGNVASTDDFYVVYQGKAVQTVTHPSDAPLQATTGTFSGDLTVDTDTLHVDSTNDRVGVGTGSPQKTFVVSNAGAAGLEINPTNRSAGIGTSLLSYNRSGSAYVRADYDASEHLMMVSGSEKARINSTGDLLVGTTTAIYNTSGATKGFEVNANGYVSVKRNTTATAGQIIFHNPNGIVGSITTTASATAYGTSSDYRLKENVTATWDATTRLKQLNPVRFNFIDNADITVDGFLAHEVQSVVPEAITGTHDEVDDDGNPVYQGIDQSKLVPLLVKTIQELEARITALENA